MGYITSFDDGETPEQFILRRRLLESQEYQAAVERHKAEMFRRNEIADEAADEDFWVFACEGEETGIYGER